MAEKKMDPAATLLQMKLWKERYVLESYNQILDIFAYGINAATEEAATEATIQLDALCPPLDWDPDVQNYMWAIWEVALDLAGSHDVTPDTQDSVVRVLQALQHIAKGDVAIYGGDGFKCRAWKDLPLLPITFKDSLNDPTSEDSGLPELTPTSAQEWRNINRFGARCLGAGVLGPYTHAMDAIQSALEDEPSPSLQVVECRLLVACEWISHAANPLLLWAQENIGYTDVPEDDTAAYTPGGVLYDGPQTMCLRRWGFWMQRFEEFGKMEGSGLSEEARAEAMKAVETMKTVEGRVGHLL